MFLVPLNLQINKLQHYILFLLALYNRPAYHLIYTSVSAMRHTIGTVEEIHGHF